jgi:hypothetical protein
MAFVILLEELETNFIAWAVFKKSGFDSLDWNIFTFSHGAEARHWIITAHPSNRFVTIHPIPTACFMDVSDKQPKTNNEID